MFWAEHAQNIFSLFAAQIVKLVFRLLFHRPANLRRFAGHRDKSCHCSKKSLLRKLFFTAVARFGQKSVKLARFNSVLEWFAHRFSDGTGIGGGGRLSFA
jgi:hypothetical protein